MFYSNTLKIAILGVAILTAISSEAFAGIQKTILIDGAESAVGTTANPIYIKGV